MIFAMGMCVGHFLQGRKYGHLGPVSDILEWLDAWKVLYLDKRYVTNMVDALSGSNIGMSLHVASVTVLVYAIGAANRTPGPLLEGFRQRMIGAVASQGALMPREARAANMTSGSRQRPMRALGQGQGA